jgi:hypothetical protein
MKPKTPKQLFVQERLFANQGRLSASIKHLENIAESKSTLASEGSILATRVIPRLRVMLREWRDPQREELAKKQFLIGAK